jgi:DNA-binding transcriptional MerR regulator
MRDGLTIGELADATGVAPRTIRFYETKGLLPSPQRSAAGYRLYAAADLKRLRLLRRVRDLGFSLTEAQALLRLAEHDECGSFVGKAAQSMVAKLAEVDAMIERLRQTRAELASTVSGLTGADWGDCQTAALDCVDCACLGA